MSTESELSEIIKVVTELLFKLKSNHQLSVSELKRLKAGMEVLRFWATMQQSKFTI